MMKLASCTNPTVDLLLWINICDKFICRSVVYKFYVVSQFVKRDSLSFSSVHVGSSPLSSLVKRFEAGTMRLKRVRRKLTRTISSQYSFFFGKTFEICKFKKTCNMAYSLFKVSFLVHLMRRESSSVAPSQTLLFFSCTILLGWITTNYYYYVSTIDAIGSKFFASCVC